MLHLEHTFQKMTIFWSIPKLFLKIEHTFGRSIHLETGAYNFGGELQFYPKNGKINYNGCRFHFSLKLLEHTILRLKMEHTFGWSIHLAVGAYISKVG